MAEPDPNALTVTVVQHAAIAMLLVRRGMAAETSRVLREHCGVDLPLPGRQSISGNDALLWSGPDRFLVVRDAGDGESAGELGAKLQGLAYVADVSSSRTVLNVSGASAAEHLSRTLPIDLHPRAFPPGSVAMTLAAHIPVQVWRPDAYSFRLAVASSLAASFQRQLAGL